MGGTMLQSCASAPSAPSKRKRRKGMTAGGSLESLAVLVVIYTTTVIAALTLLLAAKGIRRVRYALSPPQEIFAVSPLDASYTACDGTSPTQNRTVEEHVDGGRLWCLPSGLSFARLADPKDGKMMLQPGTTVLNSKQPHDDAGHFWTSETWLDKLGRFTITANNDYATTRAPMCSPFEDRLPTTTNNPSPNPQTTSYNTTLDHLPPQACAAQPTMNPLAYPVMLQHAWEGFEVFNVYHRIQAFFGLWYALQNAVPHEYRQHIQLIYPSMKTSIIHPLLQALTSYPIIYTSHETSPEWPATIANTPAFIIAQPRNLASNAWYFDRHSCTKGYSAISFVDWTSETLSFVRLEHDVYYQCHAHSISNATSCLSSSLPTLPEQGDSQTPIKASEQDCPTTDSLICASDDEQEKAMQSALIKFRSYVARAHGVDTDSSTDLALRYSWGREIASFKNRPVVVVVDTRLGNLRSASEADAVLSAVQKYFRNRIVRGRKVTVIGARFHQRPYPEQIILMQEADVSVQPEGPALMNHMFLRAGSIAVQLEVRNSAATTTTLHETHQSSSGLIGLAPTTSGRMVEARFFTTSNADDEEDEAPQLGVSASGSDWPWDMRSVPFLESRPSGGNLAGMAGISRALSNETRPDGTPHQWAYGCQNFHLPLDWWTDLIENAVNRWLAVNT